MQDYRQFLEKILQQAGDMAMGYFGNVTGSVKPEDPNQVLTEADITVGKFLVRAVEEAYPDHNIIDEEAGVVDKHSRFTWVIDPIDGTANFAAGTPDFGIMVGLLDGATPIAGGIFAPALGKLYLATEGEGATCNGVPMSASNETLLINTLVSFGIDSHADDPERTLREAKVFADIVQAVRNIRNSGSEAIDHPRVAGGNYGGRVNMASKIWDNVAPQIIAEEAGVLWTTNTGEPMDYTDPLTRAGQNFTVCVAPPALHAQLVEIVRRHIPAS